MSILDKIRMSSFEDVVDKSIQPIKIRKKEKINDNPIIEDK